MTTETSQSPRFELSKAYRPDEHEGRIWQAWLEAGVFRADPARVLSGEAPPYCILIPPPNVTAALHLGHALNNTLQDVLARAHRMKGYETLWMPGTDHAGIATQTVVDRRLKEAGKPGLAEHKAMEAAGEPGRERFVEQVQSWKDEYEARITEQLQLMGCSCDWDRQRFTMDEICARAVREAFFRLFKDGLIYRGKRLVNWDPVTQTALADDEVESKEVQGHFYYLRYPLVHESAPGDHRPVTWSELEAKGYPGAADHPEDDQAWITIATTRPETYLGDTAVAMNPRDPRADAVRGLHVELPLISRVIPIIEDDYVVLPVRYGGKEGDPKADFATGFLKVTPAHDTNDWDIGQRHDLPAINIMAPDASISADHGWTDYDPHSGGHVFIGKSREDARQLVVREFQAHTINNQPLLEAIKDYTHSVGHSYRSHAAIEPYLSDQWYCKVTDDRLRGNAQRALRADQRTAASLDAWPESTPGGTGDGTGAGTGGGTGGGTGVPPVRTTTPGSVSKSRRNLPHWEKDGATYFVTFRARSPLSEEERAVVLEACFHFDADRHDTHAVTVMTDHVHALITPRLRGSDVYWSLSDILHSIKSFSSHAINKTRNATGPVWQDESYDRIVRDTDEFFEKRDYIVKNPAEAGLVAAGTSYPFTRIGAVQTPEPERIADRRDACPTSADRRDACPTGDGALAFTPPRYARNYETWHDNLRDWCISRQLWWGHRIPVWNGYLDPDEDTPWKLNNLELQGRIHVQRAVYEMSTTSPRIGKQSKKEMPHATVLGPAHVAVRSEADAEVIQLLEQLGFTQDPDVLDTWFSSALWPLSTLGWPGDDLPAVVPAQIDFDTDPIRSVYVKRVGTWKDFIGDADAFSGELIDTLFVLRDGHKKTGGAQAVNYQLFRESDLVEHGNKAQPLLKPDEIQSATDLVCAVAVKAAGTVETKHGPVVVSTFLLSHGFQNTAGLLAAFNPTSVLCTAREIITLWVSRMAMFNRYFLGNGQSAMGNGTSEGPAPFHDVFIHAMIQDGEGRKMSKSLGNGVDPLDIVHSHGADAMRFTLVEMTTQTQDVRMPVEHDEATGRNTSPKFDLGRNFCNKLWNAARFAMGILGASPGGTGVPPVERSQLSLADRWMLARLHDGVAEIDKAMREYQFSAYAKALYDLVRRDFCDWYLEAIKPTARDNPAQQAVLRTVFDSLLRVLHPVIPFITEAIHEQLRQLPEMPIEGIDLAPSRKGDLLASAGWPIIDRDLADTDAIKRFERVRLLVDAIRQLRSQHQVNPRRKITLHVSSDMAEEIRHAEGLVETLAGIERVTTEAPPAVSVAFTFDGVEHRASDLADALDAAAERERLDKQLAELEKRRSGLAGRLANAGYIDRAPANLVQQTKDELAQVEADIEATRGALGSLA